MPVPATTGQLRTKVSEMEIGDYIPMYYSDSLKNFIIPSKLEGLNEVALTGTSGAWGNLYYYMVKVAKGLLVSDRVPYNSQPWDSLNSKKWIQGEPWNAGNIIPTMTSNTSPSGVASSSGESSGGNAAYIAFDKNTTTSTNGWNAGSSTGWLQYEFPTPIAIQAYAIYPQYSFLARAPKDWTFEGWDELKSEWIVLDNQKNISGWAANTKKMFSFGNSKTYSKYRINVIANSGDTSYLAIGELEMFETAGIIRSLTGGVAYADANGNKSSTNLELGGWPLNNEFDAFIKNFPVEKIQAGKTLSDVFHCDGSVWTWTQDTPSWMSSSNRVARGRQGAHRITYYSSSTSSASVGFRPVFEYKE